MKFGTRVCLKLSSDRGEFELDLAGSKNNIIKNSFALGHEIDQDEAPRNVWPYMKSKLFDTQVCIYLQIYLMDTKNFCKQLR